MYRFIERKSFVLVLLFFMVLMFLQPLLSKNYSADTIDTVGSVALSRGSFGVTWTDNIDVFLGDFTVSSKEQIVDVDLPNIEVWDERWVEEPFTVYISIANFTALDSDSIIPYTNIELKSSSLQEIQPLGNSDIDGLNTFYVFRSFKGDDLVSNPLPLLKGDVRDRNDRWILSSTLRVTIPPYLQPTTEGYNTVISVSIL